MGIDVGGSVAKAAIYDSTGHEICSRGMKMDTLTPRPDFFERDTMQIRDSVYRAISETLRSSGIDSGAIAAIGVTGQANGLYMFDKDGNPSYPAILSSDSRARDYIKRWNADGTLERIIPKTREILWPGQTPAIIAWFADNDPATLERTDVFLTAKDYARYLLTGEFALEATELSSTSIMDLGRHELSAEIAAELGIESYIDKYPARLLESTEIGGYVTESCAWLTGLKAGTPVVGGTIDTDAAIVAQGIVQEEQLGIILGTWGINAFITKEPIYSKEIFSAFYYCLPGYYELMEGSATSATNQEWFINTFLRQNGMEYHGYSEINRMIQQSTARNSIVFLPFLYGSNVNIDARSAFIGLTGHHGIADMLRAIYEGVVFCHMYHIDRLLKLKGTQRPKQLRIAGGGARSAVWMQMFADALDATVEVSEAEELGALGAAMVAGTGVGVFRDMHDAAQKCTRISHSYTPDITAQPYYAKKYELYRRIIDALDPLWTELTELL